jgi:beta-galactosidase
MEDLRRLSEKRIVYNRKQFHCMKTKIILCVIFCTISLNCVYSQNSGFLENVWKFIEDPGKFALNQEPGHVPLMPFPSVQSALENDWNKSGSFLSLNGEWRFNWSENPDVSPQDFYGVAFDDSKWQFLKVPSNWEMKWYGDPVFRNVSQPFISNPPHIPHDYNPVGSYRKTFSLPSDWNSKEVFLRLEGASSASFVWINGQEVGYNAGANEPAEYNITKYLKPGENLVAVNVYKYSAGTYLEDQDFWRLAGIFRDVYLFATPKVHLRDYYVTTDFDSEYRNAMLNIESEIANYTDANQRRLTVRVNLFDKNQKPILQNVVSKPLSVDGKANKRVKQTCQVLRPDRWSDEKPTLYSLTLELIDSKGKVVEVLSSRIGFKKVEVKNQALYVNGVPVKLNGVNSHMQHPDLGHTMDKETILKDFTIMKQFNINCVRTSHYPPTIDYLNLADEMGIYIIDECGDEAHATEYISEMPEWRDAYVDRLRGMVLRDRNHPSVLFWSAGNESGFGNNICEVVKEGKRLDPSRIFMYGGNSDDVAWKNEVPCEDIIGPRYATPYELRTRIAQVPESQDPRPSFMDEYISVAGNGGGGLDEYWDVIYEYPRCIGGALWDFVSPGITERILGVVDSSKNHINATIKGRGKIVYNKSGRAIDLNGQDQWVDVYRDPALDITGKQLTLSLWVYPRKWNTDGTFITKGSYQFGLRQYPKDSLDFYLTADKRTSLSVPLPEAWENKWHHLAGIYDGKTMSISIDGKQYGSKNFSGNITNKPFPVNIGRNAEIEGQEYSGRTSNAIFDEIGIFNKVIPLEQLMNPSKSLINDAALWLNFENVMDWGTFYSMGIGGRTYGLIWPDRTPQPEMWQVKKSAQPVDVKWISYEDGKVEVWNRFHFTNLDELKTSWQLMADGRVLQEGTLELSVNPLEKKQIAIPFEKPELIEGAEYRILISFSLKNAKEWAPEGFELAWNQLELPWKKTTEVLKSISSSPVTFTENTDAIIISGKDFSYTFDKNTGILRTMKYLGRELINEGPKMNVWRAPLANELDAWAVGRSYLTYRKPGMGEDAANNWRSLGLDKLTFKLDKISVSKTDENSILVDVRSHAEGIDYNTAFDNHYVYLIDGNGEITLDHTVIPQGFMPSWLPRMGIQWNINQDLTNVRWYGRGPFENYPDRKSGAKIGIYRSSVGEMIEKYLIPQDYGLRTDNRWVQLEDTNGIGLEFSGESLFNFSAQAYSTDNLTRARYPYQLKIIDGITFNFDYATSGVGCTAISVLNQYRVLPQVYNFSLSIRPYKQESQE